VAAVAEVQSLEAGAGEQRAWVVWRQDDNGIRAEVARHGHRTDAESHAAVLAARGHKLIYGVSQTEE